MSKLRKLYHFGNYKKSLETKNFFDTYQDFYKEDRTGANPPRLNQRYNALIKSNKDIIENSSVLDLASHDGRWSFAALKNNASKVIGIEGREELVKASIENMKKNKIPEEKYSFIVGDITKELKQITPGTIDVVFCFGVFYHITDHPRLLGDIKKLKAKYLILDTRISPFDTITIRLATEDSQKIGSSIKGDSPVENVIVGIPSRSAVEFMLKKLGFSFTYYNWHDQGIKDWKGIQDYQKNQRVSLVAKNLDV